MRESSAYAAIATLALLCSPLHADAAANGRGSNQAPASACEGVISPVEEARVLAVIGSSLPEGCRVRSIDRNQAFPGWKTLKPIATVVTIEIGPEGAAPASKHSEWWFVPSDWVGIRAPAPFFHDRYICAGGFYSTGELKAYYFGFASQSEVTIPWKTLAQLDWADNIAIARKTFAGRENRLEIEIAYLMKDIPEKDYGVVSDSLLCLGVPAARFFREHWKTRPDGWDRARLVSLLARFGGPQTDQLLRDAFADKGVMVRTIAMESLRDLPMNRRLPYFDVIQHFAHDPSEKGRQSAVAALAYFPTELAQPTLLELLKDKDSTWQIQFSSLSSLRKLKAKGYGRDLIPLFAKSSGPESQLLPYEVIEAAGESGDMELVPVLLNFALEKNVLRIGTETHVDPTLPWKAISAAYRVAGLKTEVRDGFRLGILVVKHQFLVNEPIHVFHVAEAVDSSAMLLLAGPLHVTDYLDEKQVGEPEPAHGYDGPAQQGPGLAANYQITTYQFAQPGKHRIQWKAGRAESNIIELEVLPGE